MPVDAFASYACTQDFMNGDNSDQAEWYKKIKAKIGHLIHQRKVHEFTSAEANADVEHEVFHVHVKARC